VTLWTTADLCDANPETQVAAPVLRDFGGVRRFAGQIATVRVHDDNALVRARLSTAGEGRVLVVGGGGSVACALVGDRLGELAVASGWRGIVIHGCVRDSAALAGLSLGVRALATNPRRSGKGGEGEHDVELHFAGVTWKPGAWLYADPDGIVLSEYPLTVDD
jgi:regulator of ribonuclease activity A